jgi:dCMP deaminase
MSKDQWCMDLCDTYAARSKDESTKLGAVIMAPLPGGQLLSGGCNSFPRGINDYVEARQARPEKYKWFVHAEANAVYNAARSGVSVEGGVLYCQWLPCPTCAMAIIQAGISSIVVASFDVPERWRGDMNVSVTMLGEAGVGIRLVDGDIQDYGFVLKVLNGGAGPQDDFNALVEDVRQHGFQETE